MSVPLFSVALVALCVFLLNGAIPARAANTLVQAIYNDSSCSNVVSVNAGISMGEVTCRANATCRSSFSGQFIRSWCYEEMQSASALLSMVNIVPPYFVEVSSPSFNRTYCPVDPMKNDTENVFVSRLGQFFYAGGSNASMSCENNQLNVKFCFPDDCGRPESYNLTASACVDRDVMDEIDHYNYIVCVLSLPDPAPMGQNVTTPASTSNSTVTAPVVATNTTTKMPVSSASYLSVKNCLYMFGVAFMVMIAGMV
jgi:hypothetical protein